MSKSDGRGVVTALLLGVAAGYIAGLLTAPKSGKETREDIKRVSKQAKEELESRLNAAKEDLSVVMDDAMRRGKDLSNKAKTELDTLLSKGRAAQSKAKEVLMAAKSGEANDTDLQHALADAKEAKKHIMQFIKKEES